MSEQEIEQEPETTRDALEAAFEEQESEPIEETEPPEAEAEASEAVETPAEGEGEPPETPAVAEDDSAAPMSWSPLAREEWANTPPAVKETITKREAEMQSVMQESAQSRQFSQNFEQSMHPFQGLFAGQGVDALTGLNEIMQTAAPLYGGSPQQKAETVAQLIQQFGVDIGTLDDLLVGNQAAPLTPEMQGMQDQINNMGSFIQQQQQGQQQQYQRQQSEVNSTVEKFISENEFAGELRGVMADFMNMAAQQGQPLDLPDAYQRAISTRPDIQQVLSDRAAGIQNTQAIGKARQAASSVPQIGGNAGAPPAPTNTREALLTAWDEMM